VTGSQYAVRSPGVEDADKLCELRFEMDEPDGIVVVATQPDGEIVGFASAGPTRDEDAPIAWELYAINVLAAHHGTGISDQLINAAIAERPATLWVVTDNARAIAFYRRHGFGLEGTTRLHEGTGVPETRWVRQHPQIRTHK